MFEVVVSIHWTLRCDPGDPSPQNDCRCGRDWGVDNKNILQVGGSLQISRLNL